MPHMFFAGMMPTEEFVSVVGLTSKPATFCVKGSDPHNRILSLKPELTRRDFPLWILIYTAPKRKAQGRGGKSENGTRSEDGELKEQPFGGSPRLRPGGLARHNAGRKRHLRGGSAGFGR